MTVVGRGLIFQPVLVTLYKNYAHYNNDTIIIIQNIIIDWYRFSIKVKNKKAKKKPQANVFDMALKLSTLNKKQKQKMTDYNEKRDRIYLTINRNKSVPKTTLNRQLKFQESA